MGTDLEQVRKENESQGGAEIQEHAGMNRLGNRFRNERIQDQIREQISGADSEMKMVVRNYSERKQIQEHAGINRLGTRFGDEHGNRFLANRKLDLRELFEPIPVARSTIVVRANSKNTAFEKKISMQEQV